MRGESKTKFFSVISFSDALRLANALHLVAALSRDTRTQTIHWTIASLSHGKDGRHMDHRTKTQQIESQNMLGKKVWS